MKCESIEQNNNKDLTIVVSSCDNYADIWFPYFEIFKHQWPDCPYNIVLNTESKLFTHTGLKIKCFQFYKEGENVPWSDRLIRHLKNIDNEYILFTLDDSFLLSPVKTEEFNKAVEYMEKNRRISSLCFMIRHEKDTKKKRLGPFARTPVNSYFRINCYTALWRRCQLLKVLKEGEDPWEFELKGTERALWDFTEYYGYIKEAIPILDVSFHLRRGYGLFLGKWVWATPELFQRFGIDMDFSIRGLLDKEFCIKFVEDEVKRNTEFDARILGKGDAFKSFIFQAKRRIPVNIRIYLSKIKRSLPIRWKD